ncbi:MAG: SH3 domain-containing protein [Elusimicrobia bacterium]|nr:SH3 domain-containing protein [Elusimicrobiota bacterium]
MHLLRGKGKRGFLVIIFGLTAGLLFGAEAWKAESKVSRLRVRAAASLGSEVVGFLAKKEPVDIVEKSTFTSTVEGQEEPWYRVKSATGVQGWVFGRYLAITQGGPLEPASTPASAQGLEVRLISVGLFRQEAQTFWVSGQGYARMGGEGALRIGSPEKPLRLEVEVLRRPGFDFIGCRAMVSEGIPDGMTLLLTGEGSFQTQKKFLRTKSVFQLDRLHSCELVPRE